MKKNNELCNFDGYVPHEFIKDHFPYEKPRNLQLETTSKIYDAIEDGYIRDKENFAKVLKEELTKHQIFETAVNFSINSSKVITREISIPFVKDKQIENVVNAQAREYFPMDISSYTISFRKMDTVETPEGKQLKILLFAIPDNLLTNYCSFAETMGLEIENFEYVGNSAVSFINSYFTEDSVVVQAVDLHLYDAFLCGKAGAAV